MTKLTTMGGVLVLLLGLGAATGCSKQRAADTTPPAEPATTATLFERLGGLPAISAVIDELLVNVLADPRISERFASAATDPAAAAHLRQMLIDQVCAATGGPCEYTGKNMVEAHVNMQITDAEFDALVECLSKALDKFEVPEREKAELLGALGGMRGDIVGK